MDHFVDGFFVGWPFFSIAPVLICDLVSFVRYFQTFLKPFHLLFWTDVDPELAENRALAEQLFLKGIDFLVGPFPFLWFGKFLDAFHQNPSIPGAIEDGHPSSCRQGFPETPQIVKLIFLICGRPYTDNPIQSGVDGSGDTLDGTSFASGIPAFKNQNSGNGSIVSFPEKPVAACLPFQQGILIRLSRKALAQIHRIELIVVLDFF